MVDILRFSSTVKICHFSVFYIFEPEYLYVFGLLVRQNQTFQNVVLGSQNL